MNRFTTLIVSFLFTSYLFSQNDTIENSSVNEPLNTAFKLEKEGKLDEALEILSEYIEKDTTNKTAYFLKGNIERFKRNYATSITDYDIAILLDSSYLNAFYNRGLAKSEIGNFRGALMDYKKCNQIDSSFVKA